MVIYKMFQLVNDTNICINVNGNNVELYINSKLIIFSN